MAVVIIVLLFLRRGLGVRAVRCEIQLQTPTIKSTQPWNRAYFDPLSILSFLSETSKENRVETELNACVFLSIVSEAPNFPGSTG